MHRLLPLLVLLLALLAPSVNAEVKRFTVPVGDSPAIGSSVAPITIIEFIDYQ